MPAATRTRVRTAKRRVRTPRASACVRPTHTPPGRVSRASQTWCRLVGFLPCAAAAGVCTHIRACVRACPRCYAAAVDKRTYARHCSSRARVYRMDLFFWSVLSPASKQQQQQQRMQGSPPSFGGGRQYPSVVLMSVYTRQLCTWTCTV